MAPLDVGRLGHHPGAAQGEAHVGGRIDPEHRAPGTIVAVRLRTRQCAEQVVEHARAAHLEADALVLTVDVSASTSQIEADFAEFVRFLRLLEQSRGQRSEVGGLPVYLVLTKCDLLARPDETPAAWLERIEERKRQVGQRFKDFLAEHKSDGPLGFGTIDLEVEATAVKQPAPRLMQESPRRGVQ